jgi:cytochrome bd-type quinol oxidase subunit 2
LRLTLLVAFLGVTVLQTLSFPGQFRYAEGQGELSSAERWLATAAVAYELLCIQAILIATWILLDRVEQDEIFRDTSRRWVNVIIAACIGFAAGPVLVLVLVAVDGPDDPGMPFLLLMVTLACVLATLLMFVMRELLGQATQLRTERDAVT